MKKPSAWSVACSLFCSLSLLPAVYSSGKDAVLAGMGQPRAVERGLAEMVSRMGGENITDVKPVAGMPVAFQEEELGRLADWVLEVGPSKRLLASMASPLGLGNADVPVRQKAYRTQADNKLHFLLVSTQNAHMDLIFALVDDHNVGVLWGTSRDGKLVATAYSHVRGGRPVVDPLPNESYAAEFEAQKAYFLSKVPPPAPAG